MVPAAVCSILRSKAGMGEIPMNTYESIPNNTIPKEYSLSLILAVLPPELVRN
jgi:hypothetical protein